MVDRQIIETIRLMKARGAPIPSIAKAVSMPSEKVEAILNTVYKNVDPHTEIMTAIDGYSVMINDLSLLIHEMQEDKKIIKNKSKRLMELFKQRQSLQDAKVKLLTNLMENPQTFKVKQVDLSAYETENKNQQYYVFMYKILSILSQLGFTRQTLKKLKTDIDTKKLIRKTVGCTKEELRECLKLIKIKEFPAPNSDVEVRLRKLWL